MTQPIPGGPAGKGNRVRRDTYNYIGWLQVTDAAREGHHFVEDMGKADRANAIVEHLRSMGDLPCEPYIIACQVQSEENAIKAAKYIRKRAAKEDFALMWWACSRYPSATNIALNRGKGDKPHRMVVALRAFGLQDLVGIVREPMAAFTMKVDIKLLEEQPRYKADITIGTPQVKWAQSFTEKDLVEVLAPLQGAEHSPSKLIEATEGVLKAFVRKDPVEPTP